MEAIKVIKKIDSKDLHIEELEKFIGVETEIIILPITKKKITSLKDILDLAMIGSLPGIGSIITAMISITIGFIMFITGSSSNKRMAKSIFKRYGTILIGSLLELVFGINFLPIETCIVIIVFYLTLKERQQIAVEKQQLKESYA